MNRLVLGIGLSVILGLGLAAGLGWCLGISRAGALQTGVDSAAAAGPAASVICVVSEGGGPYVGCAQVFTSVQAAVDGATPGDTIKVAAGRYTDISSRPVPPGYVGPPASEMITQVVYVSKTISIRGGYTTTNWTTPDPQARPTTLDAGGQGRVICIAGEITVTVEGLQVTGGDADGLGGTWLSGNPADAGGGMFVKDATFVMRDSRVFSNTAYDDGGGLYVYAADATIERNRIDENVTWYRGGGLYVQWGSAILRGNTVDNNTANYGGGVDLENVAAQVAENGVYDNTARVWGGGVYAHVAHGTRLTNNVIAHNAGGLGAGVHLGFSTGVLLQHNTIVDNNGHGVCLYNSASAVLSNTILVAHPGTGVYVEPGTTANLEGTLWGIGPWANGSDWNGPGTIVTGSVSIWGDPGFVDPAAGDYHIGPHGWGIDAGIATGVTTDFDGETRPQSGGPDIGADESPYVPDVEATPPERITDLAAVPGGTESATALSWTAPGDDFDVGTASQYDLRYSPVPIDESNWRFAKPVAGEPAPGSAGSMESMEIQVPFPGQVYYFAVRAADDVPNWSQISNVASCLSGQPADTIPPGRVVDLAATTGASLGEVELSWTAPGDDGDTGTADEYVVRRNTVPIHIGNWAQSSPVSGEPSPGPAGSSEGMSVFGLTSGQSYYFAIRAYDEAENVSGLSNSPQAVAYQTTLPDLTVTSLDVSPSTVDPGNTIQASFQLQNTGGSPAGFLVGVTYLAEHRNGSQRTELGRCRISSLASGGTMNCNVSGQIPSGADPGEYHVIVIADGFDDVSESNEGNNERATTVTIQGASPAVDLSILGVEVSQGVQVFHLDDASYHDPGYGVPPWCSPPCTWPLAAWPWQTEGPGNNEVRLVQGRTTVVRVFVDIGPLVEKVKGVEGTVEYDAGSGWRKARPLDNGTATVYADWIPDGLRAKSAASINFLLPGDELGGTTLKVRATVDPDDEIAESNESNNTLAEDLTLELHQRTPLRVLLRPIRMVDTTLPWDRIKGTGAESSDVVAYVNYARAALPFADDDLVFAWLDTPYSFRYSALDCLTGLTPSFLLGELESSSRRVGGVEYDVVAGVFPDEAGDACGAFSSLGGKAWKIGQGHAVIVRDDAGPVDDFSTLAHELGHLIPSLRHPHDERVWPDDVKTAGNSCGAGDPETRWPYDDLQLAEVGVAIREFDWNQWRRQPGDMVWLNSDECQDVMSYCPWQWPSPYSWEAWLGVDLAAGGGLQAAAASGSYRLVSGRVYTDGTATLDPIWVSDQAAISPAGTGEYCVRSLDGTGGLLDQSCFDLSFVEYETGGSLGGDAFLVSIPQTMTATTVSLTQGPVTLTQVLASPSPPTVTLMYPNGGETITETFAVTWSGDDPDGDPLVYRVWYSPDAGTTWSLLTDGLVETTLVADGAALAGTSAGLFKVIASDGFHNAEDQGDGLFTVTHKAPVAVIDPGLDGTSVPLSSTIMFAGHAFDAEEGVISSTNFLWASSRDGALGHGTTLYTSGLSAGVHQITLVVTDTDGMTGTHGVYVEILQDADSDGMPDGWELDVGLDPHTADADEDADGDGLSNSEEFYHSTDPLLPDSDYDTYDDRVEVLWGADPLDPSSLPVRRVYLPVVLRNS